MSTPSLRVTFVVPVMNETAALRETVEKIQRWASEDLLEILIVVAERTTRESLTVVRELQNANPSLVRVYCQKRPYLGGALQEAFAESRGDHILLISSDLETDPDVIPAFLSKMKEGTWDIVASSRWIKGGGFRGYDPLKLVLNLVFQQVFRILYLTRLTDLTFGYRLYKTQWLRGIVWTELKHPFLLECLIKPLRLGARVTEVPCPWRPRPEGESANTFFQTFAYVRTAIVVRFLPRSRIKAKAAA